MTDHITEVGLAEVGSGLAAFSTGLITLGTTIMPTWHSLDLLTEIKSVHSWAVVMCVMGIGQLFVFRLVDRGWSRPWLRSLAALGVGALWGLLTISTAFPPEKTSLPPWLGMSGTFWVMNLCLASRILWPRIFNRRWDSR